MKRENLGKHLLYVTGEELKRFKPKKIIGATAIWKNETAFITIFFDLEPNEDDLEEASCICTEIIAHIPIGMLDDQYIFLKNPEELPKEFLAYKRDDS